MGTRFFSREETKTEAANGGLSAHINRIPGMLYEKCHAPGASATSSGSFEGIVSDYSADAVLFTPNGPLKGHDPIREFFRALIKEFGQPGTAFSMQLQSIDGDFAQSFAGRDQAEAIAPDAGRFNSRASAGHWRCDLSSGATM